MSLSQRQPLTQPFKIATMRQQGYLLELAPSFQSWFICFGDHRQRHPNLSYTSLERRARDFAWSLDLLRRGHSPANQWQALGPFQGLRQLYHYYRGTSVGMGYISDDSIYNHLAAAMASGQLEVHKVYDPHEAYRAFAAAAASSGASSSATSDESGSESKPETRRVEATTNNTVNPADSRKAQQSSSIEEPAHSYTKAISHLPHANPEKLMRGYPNCWGAAQGKDGLELFERDYYKLTGEDLFSSSPRESLWLLEENIKAGSIDNIALVQDGIAPTGYYRVDFLTPNPQTFNGTGNQSYHFIYEADLNGERVVISKDGDNAALVFRDFESAQAFNTSGSSARSINSIDMRLNQHLLKLGSEDAISQEVSGNGVYHYVGSIGLKSP